jgi:hypothetical protein
MGSAVAAVTRVQAWDDLASADGQSTRLQAARAFGRCQVYVKGNEWHSVIKHCNEAAGRAPAQLHLPCRRW